MKRYSYILLLLVTVFSCKSKTEKTIADTSATIKVNDTETSKLIAEYKPMIEGVWVKKDYIDKVVSTRSPLLAMPNAMGINVLNIDTDSIKNDSLVVSVGWNNHEGTQMTLHFTPGKSARSLRFGNCDLSYTINTNDTLLTVSQYDEQNKLIENTTYIRALTKPFKDDLEGGLAHLINKKLIGGKYQVLNKVGANNVVFSNDGKVTGLDPHKTYVIQTDFVVQYQNNLDEMIFDLYTEQQRSYAFQIQKDTLKLFETIYNKDSTQLLRDKLIYKLLRIK